MNMSLQLLELLKKPHTEEVTISVTPVYGSSFTVGTDRIMQGSISIDRYSAAGEFPELGNASAAEFTVMLDNRDGYYDDTVFAGARLYVSCTVSDGTTTVTVPQGYFTVDNSPRRRQIITLTALDDMVRFDKPLDGTMYAMTVSELVYWCCSKCGVQIGTAMIGFTNSTVTVNVPENQSDITYRQLIIWCCEIMGMCAYIDDLSRLCIGWYNSGYQEDEMHQLRPSMRYSSALHTEDRLSMTALRLTAEDGTEYAYGGGSGVLEFRISGNELIPSDRAEEIASALYGRLSGLRTSYYPFEAQSISLPGARPLDYVVFRNADDSPHSTYLTHVKWKPNGRTELKAAGTSTERAGYAAMAPLTAREQSIIRQIASEKARSELTGMEQATIALNELITNSMGLYFSSEEQSDGSLKYYAHDAPELENSTTIYTMTDNGFAWTNSGWNNGSPVWHYGLTADGNAVLKAITTYKIVADSIYGGTLTLGGSGNTNGVITVLDASGREVTRIDNNGLKFSYGSTDFTAESITTEFSNLESAVSDVSITANKINWLVKSGTSASDFTLTDRAISLVADNINLTGYVTFNALSGEGTSIINGSNITTGKISADRIGANNGSYITFGSPIYMSALYPQIYGLDAVYFNGASTNCVIWGNNSNAGLNTIQVRATGGFYYHNGVYNYQVLHSGNIANYVVFQ